MVKILSPEERTAIQHAVLEAEQACGAEIAVVIARASDEYRAVVLTCGLALGSIIALLLWFERPITNFPALLCIQLAIPLLFIMNSKLRRLCLLLAPAHTLKRRAAQRAAAEYLHAARHLPASAPFMLIYVSLAERYVHIYASRAVQEKIPDAEWNAVVKTLTAAVEEEGVGQAAAKAIAHAGQILGPHFPSQGEALKKARITERNS